MNYFDTNFKIVVLGSLFIKKHFTFEPNLKYVFPLLVRTILEKAKELVNADT